MWYQLLFDQMKKLSLFLLTAALLTYFIPASVWHGLAYLVGFAVCALFLLVVAFCVFLFVSNRKDKKAKLEVELRNKDVRLTFAPEPPAADADLTEDPEKAHTAIAAVTGTIWAELSQPANQSDKRLHLAGAFLKAARECFGTGRFTEALGFAHQAESVRAKLMPVPEGFDPGATTIAVS